MPHLARLALLAALLFASCTEGVSPDECRAEYNKILDQYQASVSDADTKYLHNPVAAQNNHDSYVNAVNAAVDVANGAATAPRLTDCSGWNPLPHIQ